MYLAILCPVIPDFRTTNVSRSDVASRIKQCFGTKVGTACHIFDIFLGQVIESGTMRRLEFITRGIIDRGMKMDGRIPLDQRIHTHTHTHTQVYRCNVDKMSKHILRLQKDSLIECVTYANDSIS